MNIFCPFHVDSPLPKGSAKDRLNRSKNEAMDGAAPAYLLSYTFKWDAGSGKRERKEKRDVATAE
ncbi:MAG: hypothetical protein E7C36_08265 [Mixta calida]|uniref:hypothetical protein n=1 Tax=Mixta TaxID=2100764 RepID=UPI0010560AA5|nr:MULTISPECIES: hypothetical protein [Mixta]MBS6058690.1 hypothetical protein [Pantoea sp.]MCR1567100.1 hypothetical protein [Mixta sp.]MDU2733267.1 hypothetical protein [Mixta calida]MDU3817861.1 hypothetical protein [Pantoea sp.]MDU4290475.1 hypothetical protein [Mixta calida]